MSYRLSFSDLTISRYISSNENPSQISWRTGSFDLKINVGKMLVLVSGSKSYQVGLVVFEHRLNEGKSNQVLQRKYSQFTHLYILYIQQEIYASKLPTTNYDDWKMNKDDIFINHKLPLLIRCPAHQTTDEISSSLNDFYGSFLYKNQDMSV